jgi:hypothetical protein
MPRPGPFGPNVVSLKSNPPRPALNPIGKLSKEQRKIFDHTIREYHHLKRGDVPMLELYAKACVRTATAAKDKDAQAWERESRIVMAYATKLRLTAQALIEPRTAARRRVDSNRSYYDIMKEKEEDE